VFNGMGTMTLTHSTVSGNSAGLVGGGVVNSSGTTTLTHSTVSGNSAGINAGGVLNGVFGSGGTTTLTNSTVSGNSAGTFGGGVFNYGTTTLTNSTVSGNSAGTFGGSVFNYGTTTLTNSTVSGNSAGFTGGGVYNGIGLTVIEHSTVTGNTAPADQGGGVASHGDSLTLTEVRASIIAANTGTDVDFTGGATNTFDSDGDNLIGDGNATGAFNQGGDQTGVADPGLGPLADNGGPTQTHAPLAGSPAIDAVTGTCPPPAARPASCWFPSSGLGTQCVKLPLHVSITTPASPRSSLPARHNSGHWEYRQCSGGFDIAAFDRVVADII
jgi:hypothetical protein